MIIFPAIDLVGGKAVRLFKGDYNQMTVYSDRPAEIAMDFAAKGAKAIHIVDLEGARDGRTVAEVMELGKTIVSESQCMDGVRERLPLLQIEATFVDGSKLVSCHDPIGV